MRALGRVTTVLRLRTSVHRYAMRVLDDLGHAPLAEDTGHVGPRSIAIGSNPLRVVVFGGGLAIGYGVQRRADAFDGPLVERLAAASGRGAVLENRARQHVRTSAAVASLGSTGTHTYHAAIWSPSFAEGLENLDLRRWSRDLRAMIDDLHRAHPIPLVLMHMPLPAGIHPAAVVARPWVRRLNQVIDTAAAQHAHVEVATTEPFHAREIGEPVTSPAYFAAVAARLAPVVLRALDLSTDEADADAATLPARR